MTEQPNLSVSEAITAAAAAGLSGIVRGSGMAQMGLAVLLTQTPAPPSRVAETLWAVAGLQLAIGRSFAAAWQARGRAVVETTFKLHALLGQAAAQAYVAAENDTEPIERPYAELMRAFGGEPVWRGAALRWIDLHNQRLTLHRYSDIQQRRRQAEIVFLLPLDLLLKQTDEANWTATRAALSSAAEQWLTTWDLCRAAEHAKVGWNRIELPHGLQLGGHYALADEARPPTLETISQIARETGETLQVQSETLLQEAVAFPWLRAAAGQMQAAAGALCAELVKNPQLSSKTGDKILQDFLGQNIRKASWLRRFRDLLTSN